MQLCRKVRLRHIYWILSLHNTLWHKIQYLFFITLQLFSLRASRHFISACWWPSILCLDLFQLPGISFASLRCTPLSEIESLTTYLPLAIVKMSGTNGGVNGDARKKYGQ